MKKIFISIILCALAVATASAQDYLCFYADQDGSTIKLTNMGSVNVEYSFDKVNWSKLVNDQVIEMDEDQRIYLRGDNPSGFTTSTSGYPKNYRKFVMTGCFHGSGTVMSLIDPSCESKKIPCDYCFYGLFADCTALEGAPRLTATTLANYCYSYMFARSGIGAIPELPALTLKEGCYDYMFQKCKNAFYGNSQLQSALPATTLQKNCYRGMFEGCTSLEKAPYLPAEEGADDCYAYMFNGCTSLKYIAVGLKSWDVSGSSKYTPNYNWDGLGGWVQNVAAEGKFFCPESLKWEVNTSYNHRVPSGWLYNPHSVSVAEDSKDYITIKNWKDISFTSSTTFTTTQPEDATLQITAVNAVTANGEKVPVSALGNNSYSLVMPNDDVILSVEIGEKVIDQTDYLCFTANQDGSTIQLTNLGNVNVEYSYDKQNWSKIKNNQLLEFDQDQKIYFRGYNPTTFSNSDKENSFRKFVMTGSISASGNIMSLIDPTCTTTAIPCELCFYSLFANCTALVTAPKLPATTLANQCYRFMFGYTGITDMPELPALTLKEGCYRNMFEGCKSLTGASDLPATTLQKECYRGMFYGCTSLEKAPYLPAEEGADDCYAYMFNGCTSLKYIAVGLKSWDVSGSSKYTPNYNWDGLGGWVQNVAAEGKFFCPESLKWEVNTSYNHRVPSGWLYNPHNVTVAEDSKDYITLDPKYEYSSYTSKVTFSIQDRTNEDLFASAWAVSADGDSIKATLSGNTTMEFDMPNFDVSLTVKYNFKESKITTNDPIIKVQESAYYKNQVSFRLQSNRCYKVNSLNITCGEDAVYYTESDGVYTFTMPMEDVSITIDYDSYTLYDGNLIHDDETVHQCQSTRTVEAVKPERCTEAYWDFGTVHSDNAAISDRVSPTATFSNLYGTNEFVWTIKGDHCSMSEQITIINESVTPDVKTIHKTCDGTATVEAGELNEGEFFYWAKGKEKITPEIPNVLKVENLPLDDNIYYYITYNDYCTDTVSINIINNHIEAGIVGTNPRTVNESTLRLEAESLSAYGSTATGRWTTSGESLTIETPDMPTTIVNGLENYRSYTFTYTATKDECKSEATIDVEVDFSSCPVSASVPHATLKGLPDAAKIGDSFKLTVTLESGYSLTELYVNNNPVKLTGREVVIKVPDAKLVLITGDAVLVNNYLHLSNTVLATSTIRIENNGGNTPQIQYMINQIPGWHNLDESGEITLKASQTVYFKGVNPEGFSKSETQFSRFLLTNPGFQAGGTVMSLIADGEEIKSIPSDYCFYSLFRDCDNLVTAPELTATENLKPYCYARMFENCTSLVIPPSSLPSTMLSEYCYYNMFAYSGLRFTPEIKAQLFPAQSMGYMFAGCADLDSVNCTFAQWPDGATENWLAGVAENGKFVNDFLIGNTVLGPSRIPVGWTNNEGILYNGKLYTPVEQQPHTSGLSVNIYPNPAKAGEPVNVTISGDNADGARIIITNQLGIKIEDIRCLNGHATLWLPSGCYIGRCITKGETITFKLIVQ